MSDERHAYSTVVDSLGAYHANTATSDVAIAQLTEYLQHSPRQATAYGVDSHDSEQCRSWVTQQFEQYRDYWPSFCQLCQETLQISPYPAAILWMVWLPLANQLAAKHQAAGRPIVQGILGGQGTGKTTLAVVVSHLLKRMGYRVCGLSIDDLYKTHDDRQALMASDPRLRWRGPPGTHDVELGLQVLRDLKQIEKSTPIAIPRFDKSLHQGSGDRIAPEYIEGADIILFEGWFVGVRPIDRTVFDTAPPPINTEADRQFARDINHQLSEYVPLWDELDRLMIMYPMDYRISHQWRQQAEDKMKAAGKSGMSCEEIQEFVEYFWRSLHPDLFITPLLHDADNVNWVVQFNRERTIHSIYSPASDSPASRNL
ncbi:MAG: glycerate kinase, partial [Cyanobacteria bacterium P01_A01_bin.37]